MLRGGALALALTLGLGGCQSSAPPLEVAAATAEPGEYRLGPGDRMRIIVFGQEQLTGEFTVDGGGAVAFPLIGEIPAKGATARDLESRIAKSLSAGYVKDPRVSVEVLTFRPIYIIGEVNKPGQYPYANGMTVVTAVALAGGYTYRARQDSIIITRTIDGRKEERSAPPNAAILPDDVIRVPERFF